MLIKIKTMKKNVLFFIFISLFFWINVEASSPRRTPKPLNCPNDTSTCAPQFKMNMALYEKFNELREKDKQDFLCFANGYPVPNVTWFKNGINLNRSEFEWAIDRLNVDKDQGNYTCVVCNEFGCINHTYQVFIKREPKIVNEPRNQTLTVGETYHTECVVNVEPVRVDWYHTAAHKPAPKSILDLDTTPIRTDRDEVKINNTSKLIREITGENYSGWYTCEAVYGNDSKNKTVFLTVKPKEDAALNILLSLFGGVVLAVLLAIIMLFLYHKFRENNPIPPIAMRHYIRRVNVKKNLDSDSYSDELKNKIEVWVDYYPALENVDIEEGHQGYQFERDEAWDVPIENIKFYEEKPLGEGNFGIVYKAEAYSILEPGMFTPVAVKMLRKGYNEDALKNFVLETETMKVIGNHKNIINLLGCCVDKGSMMVIMEYAARGSLLNLLRTQNHVVANNEDYYAILGNNLSELTLLGFALQIAEAMEFLASKKCVHRDLAARNVLVTEKFVMKVADFGLARNVHENDYYRLISECKLPIKWMAPESLYQQKFTTRSDVWSFGITLYEMMSQGMPPYPTLSAAEVMKQVREGLRMDKPEFCSVETYKLMLDCWRYLPDERPTFTEIKERLTGQISNMEQVPENFQMDSSSSESEEE